MGFEPVVDDEVALRYLLRFLSVEGTTGRERRIGLEIVSALKELGLSDTQMRFDKVHERIPLPTESGNLWVRVPGDETKQPAILFVAHRDTVELAAGAEPVYRDGRLYPAGSTALGGDNRAGVACLVNLAAALLESRRPRPPIHLLFTVREESGLWGTRQLNRSRLEGFRFAFNLDGPSPSRFFVGAVGISLWEAQVCGRAAHAGLNPETGISAPMVAALALARLAESGWFGRIEREDGVGKSNVGTLSGRDQGLVGGASNVVADYIHVSGEARSHEETFLERVLDAHRSAFETAVRQMANGEGKLASLQFKTETLCRPFNLEADSDLVEMAVGGACRIGLTPALTIAEGGLDANWLFRHGLPTLTFGVGQRNVHSLHEHIDVNDYLWSCRLAAQLATG